MDDWVIGCTRIGHPTNYAHQHPYLTAHCADDDHFTCQTIRGMLRYDNGCDCECHSRP